MCQSKESNKISSQQSMHKGMPEKGFIYNPVCKQTVALSFTKHLYQHIKCTYRRLLQFTRKVTLTIGISEIYSLMKHNQAAAFCLEEDSDKHCHLVICSFSS